MFMCIYIYELLPAGCFAAAAATAVSRHHHRSWRWISPPRSCLLALFVCRVTSEIRVPGGDRNRPHCSYDRPRSIVTASADRHDRLSTATSWAAWYSGRSEAGRLLWPLRPLAFTLLGLWIYFAQTRSYLAAFENCWWWSGPFWISCLNLRCYKIAALFQRLAPRQHFSMPQHASACLSNLGTGFQICQGQDKYHRQFTMYRESLQFSLDQGRRTLSACAKFGWCMWSAC